MPSSKDTCGMVSIELYRQHITNSYPWLFPSDTTWPVRDLDESDTDSSGIVFHGTNVKTESEV